MGDCGCEGFVLPMWLCGTHTASTVIRILVCRRVCGTKQMLFYEREAKRYRELCHANCLVQECTIHACTVVGE